MTGHLTRNSLTLSHSLGYDCTRRNNLHVLDERTLLYASGNLLHFLDVDTGALRCRPAPPLDGVSADGVAAQVPEDGGRRHGAGSTPAPAAVRGGRARVAAGADHLLLALAGDHHDHQVSEISDQTIIKIPKHISTSSC